MFFTSVSNQKANTLGPIIKDHLPLRTPVFTDQGYPWLWGIYKNHRSVNHSARSKDARYRWARNRWSRGGVNSQTAEGNHRLLKSAFAAYCYIRPENSTRYLNEFSFLKNAHVFGLDVICENADVLAGGDDARAVRNVADDGEGAGQRRGVRWGSVRVETEGPKGPTVGIDAKGFGLKKNCLSSENWLNSFIQSFEFNADSGLAKNQDIFETSFSLLNSPTSFKSGSSLLTKEMKAHNEFWTGGKGTYIQRKKELNHQKTASKIWNLISEKNVKGRYHSVTDICSTLRIHKLSAMIILRKWLKLKLIQKKRINQAWYDRRIDFEIKRNTKSLPFLLYTNFKEQNSKSSLERVQ
ncbi:transposase [Leptospira noguchii]|uniref:ISXO2-like transposase domain protein n=1 Tax=Leptospira noguchii serovar Panama str. CZ214 TaxID=1001595 RepID=T0GTV5_9LEPT|nr:ISXO2-like transposase domain protein [Leptospira noguchii serovar Panama str. CZ214]